MGTDGVQRLRDKRGDEEVTFADVADHFEDFVIRRPDARETIDELASFLAGVEDIDHEHDEEDEGPGGSTASEASVVRTPGEDEGPALLV